MSEEASQFLQQASQAVNDGRFDQALSLVGQALRIDPTNADALVVQGIALAQTAQPEAATQSFRQAIQYSPTNPRAYYNLATHQYQLGQRQEALTMAQEAVRLDPGHTSARDLVSLIESENQPAMPPIQEQPGSPYGAPGGAPYQPSAPPNYRRGYQEAEHTIAFIQKMGDKKWVTLGWILTILTFTIGLATIVMAGPAIMEAIQLVMRDPKADPTSVKGLSSPGFSFMNIVGSVGQIGLLLWMVLDIASRRNTWVWIVGFLLGCCCGFPSLVAALYILAGRKQ